MTSFDNTLKSDEGNAVYPPDLAQTIFELNIPDRIYLKTAMELRLSVLSPFYGW